jgi:hypothetical protein
MVFAIKRSTAEGFRKRNEGLDPALALLEEWCKRATEDEEWFFRFKMMAKVPDGIPSALERFNGKPTLVSNPLHQVHRGSNYIEIDVNIAHWCYLARILLYGLWTSCGEQKGFFGCTIESREDEHMPETMLGGLQFCQLNLDAAAEWPLPESPGVKQ